MLNSSLRRKLVKISLRCLDCGAKFAYQTRFLCLDQGTLERKRAGEQIPFSEFFVQGRVVCPQCGSKDRYTLTGGQYIRLTLKILWRRIFPHRPDDWLEVAYYGSVDGRLMHPFELRDWLAEQVARSPQNVEYRVRYANALRSQGLAEEAEKEYQAALDISPRETEALTNLAVLQLERGGREKALEFLRRLAAVKPKNSKQREHVRVAKDILAGRMTLDELEIITPIVPARKK